MELPAPGQDVLLATKLHVPGPQPGFVPRPRLVRALGDGLARGRVLVCAPAGSGKTALLADWVRGHGGPVAWLGMDAADSDPVRFWRHAVAALDRVRPGLAARAGPLLGPPAPGSFAGLVTALINELAAAAPDPAGALLVLDDYHLTDSRPVHESVAFLLENLPPGLCVAVSSRADPPLPLARLRARGQLTELRTADLRFTPEEAAALLGQAELPDETAQSGGTAWPGQAPVPGEGVPGEGAPGKPARPGLPAAAVVALTARTEGWAAGLRLAALSLRGQADPAGFVAAFSGSHRYVLDYLADEVLDRQAGPVRAFLLETSVLERLSGELCDAVTGRAGSQAMLVGIERAGLFLVPLDEDRRWWRYHHLFADLLRARLQAEQPDRIQALHRAAAAWCDEHDLADDAVRHALAAGDPAWAARLVERHVVPLLGRSEGATLHRWLSALPPESMRDRPRLYLAQAYGVAMAGRVEALEPLLDEADRAFAAGSDQSAEVTEMTEMTEAAEAAAARAWSVLANVGAGIAFLRAELARLRGDVAGAACYGEQALARLGEDDWLMRSLIRASLAVADWLGGRLGAAERALAEVLAERRAAGEFFAGFLAMRACYDLGEVQRAQGNLDAALATYGQALSEAGQGSQAAHTGMAHVGLAQVLYERDELTAALDHATRGVALCRQLAFTAPLATGLAVVARIRQALGDPAGAGEAMAEASRVGLSPQVTPLLNPVPALRARLLLAQGDVGAAAQWAILPGPCLPGERPPVPPDARLIARSAILSGPAHEPDYPREPACLVQARVLLARARPGPALALLDRLLALAASQDRAGSVIEIQALRALALAAGGDREGALAALAEALALGSRHGHVRVLTDEGAPMHALLAELSRSAVAGRIDPRYLATLLRSCGTPVAGQAAAPPPRPAAVALPGALRGAPPGALPGPAEPLTGRELEVLRLLAAGRSNQRIARDLVVALDTVKKHVTHILGKLGAANRTEAAARARQLGLVP